MGVRIGQRIWLIQMHQRNSKRAHPVDVRCPNCGLICGAFPPPVSTDCFDRFGNEAAVICPTCDWEFCIDSDSELTDDGEIATEWELEIDADGELTDAREALLSMSSAEIARLEEVSKGWSYDDNES